MKNNFELIKDLSITCIIMIMDVIYMPFPLMLPYLYSYIKHIDETLTLSWAYSVIICVYIGSIIANIFLPRFFFVLGIKYTFIFGGLLYFLDTCFLVFFGGKYTLLLFGLIGGICLNFKTLPTNYYLTNKYENGVQYLPYSYIGQSIGVLVWTICISFMVNPENKNMDAVSYLNGYKENYFDTSVSNNLPYFLIFNGFLSFIIIGFVSLFLNPSEELKGNFSLWWKAIIHKDKESQVELEIKFEKMNKTVIFEHVSSIMNQHSVLLDKNFSKNDVSQISLNKKDESLIESSKGILTLEEEINKEMYSLKFIFFILIIFIKNSSSSLMINCFKIMAIKIIQNDSLASIIYSISTLADIFGRFAVSYCWKKYGFYKTHVYNFAYNIFFNLVFVLYGYKDKTTFIIVIAFVSLSWAFGYLLGHTTIFGLYRPTKAVGLAKAFDVYYILQSLYGIIMTNLFLSKEKYQECFLVFIIIELIFASIFYMFYQDFGDIKKQN